MRNIQVRLNESQSAAIDRAAVQLGAKQGKPANVQDLVRAWVDGGCPLAAVPEKPAPPEPAALGAVISTPVQAAQAARNAAMQFDRKPLTKPSGGI